MHKNLSKHRPHLRSGLATLGLVIISFWMIPDRANAQIGNRIHRAFSTGRSAIPYVPDLNQNEAAAGLAFLEVVAFDDFRIVRAFFTKILNTINPLSMVEAFEQAKKQRSNLKSIGESSEKQSGEPAKKPPNPRKVTRLKLIKRIGSNPRVQDLLKRGYDRVIEEFRQDKFRKQK